MPNTQQEAVLSEIEAPLNVAPAPRRHWSRWPKWLLAFFICLWLVDFGFSLFIRHSNLRNRFTARLAVAFGRPVQVGDYDFTFWTGPTLSAQSLTVAEDPRFGHEYFLRADSVSVHLRWQSLLLGHVELGTLALTRPSLNIVRDAEGDWNLADWLPHSSGPASLVGPRQAAAPLFRRIEVHGGRINFKYGDNKLPLGFVDVTGAVDTLQNRKSSGLWQIDLQATPWRAADVLQQAGTIRMAGQVGGTSSRLLPAALDFSWTDASVSDVLRLAQSYDYGIRGTMNLAFAARTEGESWTLQGRAELRQIHRWDLALRPDNPSVNLIAKMKLYPLASGIEVTQATLEGPGSNAQLSGSLLWNQPPAKHFAALPASAIQVTSSAIDLADFLSWVRAFDANVTGDIRLKGFAGFTAAFSGWPLRLAQASITSIGGELSGQRLRVPVQSGPVEIHYDGSHFVLPPVALTFGNASDPLAGLFHVDASIPRRSKGPAVWHLAGNTAEIRDLIATAIALGWNLSRGWDLAGPFRCDLSWPAARFPAEIQPVGFAELGGASLHAPFLNQPVDQIRARADWKPGIHHIALASARAFGAHWSGSFDHPRAQGWQFALSVDHLAAADLDQWLNPRWRESFIDRVLPFLGSSSSASAMPENLRASGTIALDQFTLAPLVLHRIRGGVDIDGRHIDLTGAQGQWYGGDVKGSLEADLDSVPAYRASADFSGVDLSSLTGASIEFANLFDGVASGTIAFEAHGGSRADLLASLECHGGADVRDAQLLNIDLPDSLSSSTRRPGKSTFREASAAFTCKNHQIVFQDVLLRGPEMQLVGAGSVDASRNLDFHLNVLPADSPDPVIPVGSTTASVGTYRVSGPLSAPQVDRARAPARSLR